MWSRQPPALAFGCSYSVVKERRRSTLPLGRRCHRAVCACPLGAAAHVTFQMRALRPTWRSLRPGQPRSERLLSVARLSPVSSSETLLAARGSVLLRSVGPGISPGLTAQKDLSGSSAVPTHSARPGPTIARARHGPRSSSRDRSSPLPTARQEVVSRRPAARHRRGR